jgi:CRISPR-associated protein Cst2
MKNIKSILVSMVAPMSNHIANGGEKLLGNASSIKRRTDGRVYVSGQMQRHVLFSAINRLNEDHAQKGDTYVSNGDGISDEIEKDLRADMGGFMHPQAGAYSGRRMAPLTVTPAVALAPSQLTRDLLVRMKTNGDGRDQALATKEMSDEDQMLMNFFLDVSALSVSKKYQYEGDMHVKTEYVKHVGEDERKRRAALFLEGSCSMTDFANQARNAVSGEPQKVLIVFDEKMSRKAVRYFEANPIEQQNILNELQSRGAIYFLGDDTQGDLSVYAAIQKAMDFLAKTPLYDPCGGDAQIQTFAQVFKDEKHAPTKKGKKGGKEAEE